ncbi:peptidylprolyl isomerase [Geobacter sp. DSM 9736]|uniref:FKBP-type peptidyl-prolyl cis-trans isomerase n=1 Tax=Geobacter sp. DSM 9736 TaxID=1277350 RepID=UPI000B50D305|nr:peptidylprolyl isomerase [Geobacter sp. DSM 9736]SNB47453.1 peptidylprolyl isomerase [Geobacter sp. DSM 9736]
MAQAKQGDRVKVHYTGKLEDGTVFDSSECNDSGCGCEDGALEFTIGEGQVIPGFEQAVVGMSPGDRKTVNIPVDQAYGERVDDMVAVVERSDIPQDLPLEVGNQLEVTQEDGNSFPVVITELTDTTVTLDANHPLAGRNLIFDLNLVEIG